MWRDQLDRHLFERAVMVATQKAGRKSSVEHFPVVGIGASAGGLRAIQSFFDNLPADTGMSFVVIVHLDPDHKSQMADLVQSHTSMPVTQPNRPLKLEPNRVYIIPPDKDFSLADGRIRMDARGTPNRNRAPIDLFFRTLAETHQSHSVAIILSGTGSDGSQGIRLVRERGGLTMAQTPDEAEFQEMPKNAIATGQVDFVLPVAALAAEAVRLNREGRLHRDGDEDVAKIDEADEDTIAKILVHLNKKTGHDFGGYRRATVLRRIERRVHFTHSADLSEYLLRLTASSDEAQALLNDLLITVTSFFRDPEAFEALERKVIPKLFAEADPEDGIRVWVAGCATGEEAYSIAMILKEQAELLDHAPPIQVFATDVHERSFAIAREGLYPEAIALDVPAARLDRFFTKEPGGFRIRKQIREKVLFANHNLLRDPPFLRLDLVTCRNLMIYLDHDAKRRVASAFHFGLRPGGYLLLGTSEATDEPSKMFAAVDKKHRIYTALPGRAPYFSAPQQRPSPVRALESRAMARTTRVPSAWTLHQQLLEEYAAPSLLVNAEGIVIHLSSRVGEYLRRHGGEPSHRLLDMLPQAVRPRFRALLSRAFSEGKMTRASGLRFDVRGKRQRVDVIVRPLDSDRSHEKAALVLFEQERDKNESRAMTGRPRRAAKSEPAASDTDRELYDLRTQLQATIEEHEAVVEEARASNEELQSINEEQRATTEELESSKEELQSVNEELRAINQEYRNQNEQLGQTNSDLENLMDSTDIGTIFLDRDFRVRRFTAAVAGIFNFKLSDVGRSVSDMTHRLRYGELMADLRQVLRTLTRVEREVLGEDGRWFTLRISPYRSIHDRIDGVVITLFDTTDRKRAEIDRELLLRDARLASVAKSNFISVMSHELRTPLNAILGYAGIMNAGAVGSITPEQSRQLDRITASAGHLARLIDDTLEAARMEAGAKSMHHDEVDLTFLVREVGEALTPIASKRGLTMNMDVPGELVVFSDATKLRQILFNLVANAVRYTDTGSIGIRVNADSKRLTIAVSDTGIGIAPEHFERIFERFWQVDQTLTRRRGGTGLGLMVSRGLARELGGDIVVTSELGRGSIFTLWLPLEPRDESAS